MAKHKDIKEMIDLSDTAGASSSEPHAASSPPPEDAARYSETLPAEKNEGETRDGEGPTVLGSTTRTFEDDLSRATDKTEDPPREASFDEQFNEAWEKEHARLPVRVEVICEGVLGPRLLRKGEQTDDPAYVKLLETERGRRLVKRAG